MTIRGNTVPTGALVPPCAFMVRPPATFTKLAPVLLPPVSAEAPPLEVVPGIWYVKGVGRCVSC
jgi:hypothetical protein